MTARGKLTQLNARFIEALTEDFEKHGTDALERVRINSPEKYCTLAADLIPKTIIHDEANAFQKVQTIEELKPIFIEAVVEYGWLDDAIALAASKAKAMPPSLPEHKTNG
jgi:hypothetical protein